MVAGEAGLGKSTLVNHVFGIDIAATGAGEPVTSTNKAYTDPGGFIRVIDTVGFVRSVDGAANHPKFNGSDLVRYIELSTEAEKIKMPHVDMVWFFIERIQPEDVFVFKQLIAKKVPFLIIIAKADAKSPDAVATIRLQLHSLLGTSSPHDPPSMDMDPSLRGWDTVEMRNPPLVGPPCHECGSNTILRPWKGSKRAWYCSKEGCDFSDQYVGFEDTRSLTDSLKSLSATTQSLLKDVPGRRFQVAQLIDVEPKKRLATQIVAIATLAAAGIGATPIPFADMPLLLATQYTMIISICKVFGLKATVINDLMLYVAIIAASPFPFLGILAANALRALVPVAGALGAAAIEAPVAGGLTLAMGLAVIRSCSNLLKARLKGGTLAPGRPEFKLDNEIQRAVADSLRETAAWIKGALLNGKLTRENLVKHIEDTLSEGVQSTAVSIHFADEESLPPSEWGDKEDPIPPVDVQLVTRQIETRDLHQEDVDNVWLSNGLWQD
ncbi:hypothetical protein BC830DRAFT_1079801 [Chytriomyces sp. MP71]|nr:hypothetical protein BC830DRAFT_1079801 [Chytriomyces sp. MP71]